MPPVLTHSSAYDRIVTEDSVATMVCQAPSGLHIDAQFQI
jgi:hypothetical protein